MSPQGELKVIVTAPSVKRGTARRFFEAGTLGPGAIFGEVGVVNNTPRTASVISACACEVLALSRVDIATRAPSVLVRMEESLRAGTDVNSSISHPSALGARKAYLGRAELSAAYRKALRWEKYKERCIAQVMAQSKHGRRQGVLYRFVDK